MRDGFVHALPTPTTAVDGLPPGEGAFLPCTFWLADNLRAAGAARRGARSCSSGCSRCATTSACSPRSTTREARRLLGNFPQAFSHVALVNTAFNLDAAGAGEPDGPALAVRGAGRLLTVAEVVGAGQVDAHIVLA